MIKKFIEDETGATAIEYALIASLLATGIVGSLGLLRAEYTGMYDDVATGMVEAKNP